MYGCSFILLPVRAVTPLRHAEALRAVPGESSLALIGNASAHELLIEERKFPTEAFSIRRLEGRRWRLRRTLAMGNQCRFRIATT